MKYLLVLCVFLSFCNLNASETTIPNFDDALKNIKKHIDGNKCSNKELAAIEETLQNSPNISEAYYSIISDVEEVASTTLYHKSFDRLPIIITSSVAGILYSQLKSEQPNYTTPLLVGGIIIPAVMELGDWIAKIPRIPESVKSIITPAILGGISAATLAYPVFFPLIAATTAIGTFKVVKPLNNWLTGKNERRRIVKLERLQNVLKAAKLDFQEGLGETTATNDSN